MPEPCAAEVSLTLPGMYSFIVGSVARFGSTGGIDSMLGGNVTGLVGSLFMKNCAVL